MIYRKYLYILLLFATMLQVVIMKYFVWFPDLILIIVVFAGIFYGFKAGFEMGLVAGILRGIFSAGTISVDLFVFASVGILSALLARMLYRQNPLVQIVIMTIALFTAVLLHTVYLNSLYGNDLKTAVVFLKSWPVVISTIGISTLVFLLLKKTFNVEI